METVRKLVKELSRVRASVMGTSLVWGASSGSDGPGRGGGGIDMLDSFVDADPVPTSPKLVTQEIEE